MAYRSTPELLVLHGAWVLGGPSAAAIATRFGLAEADVREHLLDAQAYGWVSRYDYFGETWSLTERGREVGERLLAEELAATGTLELVSQVHRDFLPLNVRHGIASTRWQLKPTRWDPRAFNDHSDPVWDHEVGGDRRPASGISVRVGGVARQQRQRGQGERDAAQDDEEAYEEAVFG